MTQIDVGLAPKIPNFLYFFYSFDATTFTIGIFLGWLLGKGGGESGAFRSRNDMYNYKQKRTCFS